jgi:ATP-dependent Zn protease
MRKREAGLLKESMTKKEREPYTAYHEAGHVAIAHVLGIEYGSVTIIPDAVGMGCTTIRSPRVTLDAWDARGRSRSNGRDLRSIYRACIMEAMAGREAAELCCGPGDNFVGDGDDIRQIESLIRDYDLDLSYFGLPCGDGGLDRLDRMRRATRHLVARHREKIERVAQALLKRKTLSANQVRAVMLKPRSREVRYADE